MQANLEVLPLQILLKYVIKILQSWTHFEMTLALFLLWHQEVDLESRDHVLQERANENRLNSTI